MRRSGFIASRCVAIPAAPARSGAASAPCANTRSYTAKSASPTAPKGRAGGHDGAMARTVIYRVGGGEEVVPSKLVTTLHVGDRVEFETAGGGGYGDPARRDAQKVRADLADGKISAEGANIYGPGRDDAG